MSTWADVPRIVLRLPDGASLWQRGDQYLVSWDALILSESHYDVGWFDSPEAARLAWETAAVDPITLKTTRVIIPGPVRQWMAEKGITVQDVIDMLKETTK